MAVRPVRVAAWPFIQTVLSSRSRRRTAPGQLCAMSRNREFGAAGAARTLSAGTLAPSAGPLSAGKPAVRCGESLALTGEKARDDTFISALDRDSLGPARGYSGSDSPSGDRTNVRSVVHRFGCCGSTRPLSPFLASDCQFTRAGAPAAPFERQDIAALRWFCRIVGYDKKLNRR